MWDTDDRYLKCIEEIFPNNMWNIVLDKISSELTPLIVMYLNCRTC